MFYFHISILLKKVLNAKKFNKNSIQFIFVSTNKFNVQNSAIACSKKKKIQQKKVIRIKEIKANKSNICIQFIYKLCSGRLTSLNILWLCTQIKVGLTKFQGSKRSKRVRHCSNHLINDTVCKSQSKTT